MPADEIGWVGWVGSMVGFDVEITTALNSNLGCHFFDMKKGRLFMLRTARVL